MPESAEDSDKRPFAAVLHDLNKGRTHAQLGDELRELVAAVVETGKAGSLTLRLDIKPLSGNDEGITITARIGSKVPVFDSPASVFFVDAEHNLNRNPTSQPSIFDSEDSSR